MLDSDCRSRKLEMTKNEVAVKGRKRFDTVKNWKMEGETNFVVLIEGEWSCGYQSAEIWSGSTLHS